MRDMGDMCDVCSLPFEIRVLVSEFLPIHSTSLLTIEDSTENSPVVVLKKVDVCFRADRAQPYLKVTDEFPLNVDIPRNSHTRHARATLPDGNTIHIIYVSHGSNFYQRILYVYDQDADTLSTIDVTLNSASAPMICSFCAIILFITVLFLRLDDKVSSSVLFLSFIFGLFGVLIVTLHFRMREGHTHLWDFKIMTPENVTPASVCIVMFGPRATYEITLSKNRQRCWTAWQFGPIPHSPRRLVSACGPGVVYVLNPTAQQLMLEFHTTQSAVQALRIPVRPCDFPPNDVQLVPIDTERCALRISFQSWTCVYLADSNRQTVTILARAPSSQRINVTVMHNRLLTGVLLSKQCSLCLMLELGSDVKLFFVGRLLDYCSIP